MTADSLPKAIMTSLQMWTLRKISLKQKKDYLHFNFYNPLNILRECQKMIAYIILIM